MTKGNNFVGSPNLTITFFDKSVHTGFHGNVQGRAHDKRVGCAVG